MHAAWPFWPRRLLLFFPTHPGIPCRSRRHATRVGSGSSARWPGFYPFGRLRDPGPAVVQWALGYRPRWLSTSRISKKRTCAHGDGGRVRACAYALFADTTELDDAASSDINFQDSLSYTAPSSDLYIDDDELGKLLGEVHRDCADYRRAEGVNVSQSSVSVMFDRTGEPVERSDSDHFPCSVRNVKSAQNQFPVITQATRMVDRKGKPVEEMIAEERESSGAQIRTMLNEQRKTIIAEYGEKVSWHELLAAHAEQERKILREEFWRQQQVFREVHQQILTEMEEFQKFQNSAFDSSPDRSSSRIRRLLWNCLEDFKNCRMK